MRTDGRDKANEYSLRITPFCCIVSFQLPPLVSGIHNKDENFSRQYRNERKFLRKLSQATSKGRDYLIRNNILMLSTRKKEQWRNVMQYIATLPGTRLERPDTTSSSYLCRLYGGTGPRHLALPG